MDTYKSSAYLNHYNSKPKLETLDVNTKSCLSSKLNLQKKIGMNKNMLTYADLNPEVKSQAYKHFYNISSNVTCNSRNKMNLKFCQLVSLQESPHDHYFYNSLYQKYSNENKKKSSKRINKPKIMSLTNENHQFIPNNKKSHIQNNEELPTIPTLYTDPGEGDKEMNKKIVEEEKIEIDNSPLSRNALLLRKSKELENLRKQSRIFDMKKNLFNNIIDNNKDNSSKNKTALDREREKEDTQPLNKERSKSPRKSMPKKKIPSKSLQSEDLIPKKAKKEKEDIDKIDTSSKNKKVKRKDSQGTNKLQLNLPNIVDIKSINGNSSRNENNDHNSKYSQIKVKTDTDSFKPKRKYKLLCCF